MSLKKSCFNLTDMTYRREMLIDDFPDNILYVAESLLLIILANSLIVILFFLR